MTKPSHTDVTSIAEFRAKRANASQPIATEADRASDELADWIRAAYNQMLESRGEEPDPEGRRFFEVVEAHPREFFTLFGQRMAHLRRR